jgi:hypothetical protein
MFGGAFVALAASVGVAIWVYNKTAIRGGIEWKKQIAPAAIAGVMTFIVMMTVVVGLL